MAFSGYAELAEEEEFVVVAPTGLVGSNTLTGANWELPQNQQAGRDDVQMAADLIDLVATMVCIDLDRVYATGMSNGGYFSSLLACRLNERIAAIFSVAAVMFPDDCQASRAMGVGAIHGTDDVVVPFGGGGVSVLGQAPLFELVMPEQMKKFANEFDCEFTREKLVGRETRLTVYSSCKDGVEVRFWAVEGGGHTWPGSPFAKVLEDRLGYSTDDFDATRQGYQFMSRYSLSR
jgi:polyhydroxybutyrate depolymerase